MPAAVSLIGASKKAIHNIRNKFLIDQKEISTRNYIQQFDVVLRKPVDERDKEMLDSGIMERMECLMLPYMRKVYSDDETELALSMSSQMSSVLASSEFICMDVTYPDVNLYRYLMNIAALNLQLIEWQVVIRVLMSRLTTKAYSTTAFGMVANECTAEYPAFQNGEGIVGILLYFSDAQAKGVKSVLGCQKAAEILRGCKVHWLRQAGKQSDKMCTTKAEENLIMRICKELQKIEDELKADFFFDVLSGTKESAYLNGFFEMSMGEADGSRCPQ